MKFGEWLLEQKDRNCPIGDLAEDFAEDTNVPVAVKKTQGVLEFSARLSYRRACDDAVTAFREAIAEFEGESDWNKRPRPQTIDEAMQYSIIREDAARQFLRRWWPKGFRMTVRREDLTETMPSLEIVE